MNTVMYKADTFMIKDEIENLGYKVKVTTIEKNGSYKDAIMFVDDTLASPVFYPDNYFGTFHEIAEDIIGDYNYLTVKEHNNKVIEIINNMTWDDVKDKLIICVQRYTPDANYITKNYLDLTIYVRVIINDNYSAKVNKEFIEMLGVTEDKIWDTAKENTEKDLKTISIGSFIGLDIFSSFPLALTTKDGRYGAANIYVTNKLMEIAKTINNDLYILPSSIHEIIVVPCSIDMDVEDLRGMVRSVNLEENVITEDEILGYSIYKYDLKHNMITLV